MLTPSNLYAEKIFAEHPIGMWALDDSVDFLSLLDSNDKQFSTDTGYWSISNGEFGEAVVSSVNPPMTNEYTTKISSDDSTNVITITSREIFQTSELDPEKGSFTISSYFRAEEDVVSTLQFGYFDGTQNVLETYTLPESYASNWVFLSKTFDIPDSAVPISVVIKISHSSSASTDFYLNGIAVGQWSEQNNMYTTGVIPEPIDEDIALEDVLAIPASAYGLQESNGYYLAKDEKLFATNSGVPMVFGAYSVTKIFPSDSNNVPSLIVPGFGFLNESGKAKSYTVEMWLRINSKTTETKRVFGPIASDDGLYVDGQYLTLKIGSSYRSHSIRDWNRPMLVDIKYTEKTASLTINGEQVFDMTLSDLEFPDRLDVEGKQNDWLGFYAYDDVPVIEIDCVAIYSYLVPEVVIKRRFVYGQGVDFPENLNTGYSGKSVYVDYKFSNYSKNYIYPDIGRWKQGILENVDVRNNHLETPVYPTPTLFIDYNKSQISAVEVTVDDIIYTSNHSFSEGDRVTISGIAGYSLSDVLVKSVTTTTFSIDNSNDLDAVAQASVTGIAKSTSKKSSDDLIADISYANNQNVSEASKYLTFKPNSSWSNTYSYLTLSNLNLLNQSTEAFYAIFKSVDNSLSKQTLLRIENQASKDYLDISLIDGDTIRYSIKYGETELTTIYEESGYVVNNLLQVGMNINKASAYYGNSIRSFFGSKEALTLYIGGEPGLVNQFTGNIYKLGLSTKRNARKIDEFFDKSGILLNVSGVFNDYFIDDDLDEQIDVTYDGGLVTVSGNSLVIDGGDPTSFGYPRVYGHVASYTFLPNEYLGNYILDVIVDSYWHDYVPLKYFGKYINDGENAKVYDLDYLQFNVDFPLIEKYAGDQYDTNLMNARFYVSFKYAADRANSDIDFLSFYETLSDTNVVIPADNWFNTKYEVGDNTIIYPPSNIDFNKVVMHIHIEYMGSSTANRKTKINSLALAGNAFNKTKPTAIGTRFGSSITPVTKRGIYSDYRSKNPIIISKSSKPYLYLDDSTGIGLRPLAENTGDRSLRIKVNPDSQPLYRIGAMQMATKYSFKRFPVEPEKVFEITSVDETINFYVVAANESGTRGKFYALDNKHKLPYSNVSFYVNGNSVKDAYIDVDTWSILGLKFSTALNFDNDSYGDFAIAGKMFTNNVLFYQVSADENAKTRILRSWGLVRSMLEKGEDLESTPLDESKTWWSDFVSEGIEYGDIVSPVQWGTVLFIPTDRESSIDPQSLYMIYLGTNKTIVGDDVQLILNNYEYRSYSDISWQTSTITPV